MSTPASARIRLLAKRQRGDFGGALDKALLESGRILVNETKLNIRRQRLIDTSNLINSISSELYKTPHGARGVGVGSRGVPYAARLEYGFQGKETVKPFSRKLNAGKISAVKAHTRRGANVKAHTRTQIKSHAEVRQHMRNVNRKARPYLTPAFVKLRDRITRLITKAVSP